MSEIEQKPFEGDATGPLREKSRQDTKVAGGEERLNTEPLSGGPDSPREMATPVSDADLEMYKVIMSLWDSEMTRFYSRQNLYIGIQVAAFAGLMAGLKGLLAFPGFIRLALGFLSMVGLITALIATRGLTTQALTIKVIEELEHRNVGLDLIALGRKHTRVYLLTNFVLSVALAWIMGLLWLVVWTYLELRYL